MPAFSPQNDGLRRDDVVRGQRVDDGRAVVLPEDGDLGHQQGVFPHALVNVGLDVHARQQVAVRVRHLHAHRDRAHRLVDGDLGELEDALFIEGLAVLEEETDLSGLLGGLIRAVCEAPLEIEVIRDGHVQIHVHRVELLDRRHRVGLAVGDQGAFGGVGASDRAGNRGVNLGVGEIYFRGFDGRLGGKNLGLGRLVPREGVVVFLFADGIGVDQLAVSAEFQLGGVEVRLGLGQGRPGAGELGLVGGGVDLVQLIALLHHRALGEKSFQDHARHLGTDLRGAHGRRPAYEGRYHGHVADFHRGDVNGLGRHAPQLPLLAFAAGREEGSRRDDGDNSGDIFKIRFHVLCCAPILLIITRLYYVFRPFFYTYITDRIYRSVYNWKTGRVRNRPARKAAAGPRARGIPDITENGAKNKRRSFKDPAGHHGRRQTAFLRKRL